MPRQSVKQTPRKETSQLEDSWVVDTDEDGDYSPPLSSSTLKSSNSTLGTGRQKPQAEVESNVVLRKKQLLKNPNSPSRSSASNLKGSSRGPWKEASSESKSPSKLNSNITVASDEDRGLGSDDDLSESIYSSSEGSRSKQARAVERSQTLAKSSEKPRRRQTRTAKTGAEPDLIMPSIYEDNMDGSWVDENKSKQDKRFHTSNSIPMRSQKRERPDSSRAKRPINQSRQDATAETFLSLLRPILGWFYDVTGGALGALKKPISYFLAVYLFLGLLLLLRNLLTNSVYSALSPICRLPGSSFLHLPMCQSGTAAYHKGSEPPPVQFDQLMRVQSNFEAILEESASGVSLPLNMKRGEASIRDLRQVVRHSSLRSKNELVLEFDGFIETARIASYDLQKFNSHVGRGVDNILATARWTKRVLDGIADRDSSLGTIGFFFTNKLLAPFQPLKFTQDVLLDQYIQHTRVVEEEIHRLIAEAQALLLVLQNLEDRLDVMHGISVRDDLHAQSSKAEVLSQIWTMVGGNRGKLGKYDSQLRLLEQVNSYRQSAIAHVSGTMVKLQGMGAELEELRERVGGVELLGINGGVPLSVHIENIELGVERLETGRNRAKGVENEELRKTLKGAGEAKGIEEG